MISVAETLKRIQHCPWFAAVGCRDGRKQGEEAIAEYFSAMGLEVPKICWMSGWSDCASLVEAMDRQAALWDIHETERRRAQAVIEERGRQPQLEQALNRLIWDCYNGRTRPNLQDEELSRVAAGAAQWTAGEVLTWEFAGDKLGGRNPFLPKLQVFELGHWPLGFQDQQYAIF